MSLRHGRKLAEIQTDARPPINHEDVWVFIGYLYISATIFVNTTHGTLTSVGFIVTRGSLQFQKVLLILLARSRFRIGGHHSRFGSEQQP